MVNKEQVVKHALYSIIAHSNYHIPGIDLLITNLKNFETSNVQYTNVIVSLGFSVKGFVDSFDQPVEHTIVQRFRQSTNGVDDLLFVLALKDELGSDFDFGFKQAFQEVTSVDTQQEGDLLGFCEMIVKMIFNVNVIPTFKLYDIMF
jgi:hypothetical protein